MQRFGGIKEAGLLWLLGAPIAVVLIALFFLRCN